MFLVLTEYLRPIEEIERFLPDHSVHLEKYYRLGKIIFSGRMQPRTGGIILFSADNRKEVEEIIENDPFRKNGCAAYKLIEFIPTKYAAGFKDFLPS